MSLTGIEYFGLWCIVTVLLLIAVAADNWTNQNDR